MDTLTPLLQNIFPDSKIARNLALKRTKSQAMITNCLGKHFSIELSKNIKNEGGYFSIIIDETTDRSSIKQCAFVVMYFNNISNRVITNFLDLKEVSKGTAVDLYEVLKNCLTSKNIPLKNVIGFASDTPNVVVGEHNSVFSLLKKELPDIICIKCSCHLIHLAASKACLHLPRSIEDLLRNLGSHFNRSYIRQEQLKEFQLYFGTEVHKILSAVITRWLSIKACVDRVLEQYDALNSYLRLQVFEDPSVESMLETMNNKTTKIYLEFLSYVLGLLTEFNILFQSETPLLHKLKPEVKNLLITFCSNFLKIECIKREDIFKLDHKNSNQFVPFKDIYVGIEASSSIKDNYLQLSDNDKSQILQDCLKFYIEVVSQIKKRFDFKDEIFELIFIVEPAFAQSFEVKTLTKLCQKFPFLNIDRQELDTEWRKHALLDHEKYELYSHLTAEVYWKKVFELKNSASVPMFPNLKKMIALLLILPFSNSCVERIFSQLKISKTDHRNKIGTDTLAAIFSTKDGLKNEGQGGLLSFEPSESLIKSKVWNIKN